MFERYLVDALTKHFGHLVENVDAEKVRLSAWSGKLVLEDVYLRSDALDSLCGGGNKGGGGDPDKCPVELAYGKVGRLDVQVPWSLVGAELWRRKTAKSKNNNTSEGGGQGDAEEDTSAVENDSSISVILSDVNILITPRREKLCSEVDKNGNGQHDSEDDEDEIFWKRNGRERKEKLAQELLDAQLLSRVANSSSHSSTTLASSRWQWIQELVSKLLSNLSVTAQNIHIRYEDPGHCMGFVWSSSSPSSQGFRRYRKSFAIGLTLGEFSVKTRKQKADDADVPVKRLSGRSMNDDEETDPSKFARPSSPGSLPSCDSSMAEPRMRDNDDQHQQQLLQQCVAYRIQRKIATAENLAIYWDSGGCSLVSETRPGSSTKEQPLLERTHVESAFRELHKDGETGNTSTGRAEHTYLLDPVSPSVEFALVAKDNSPSKPAETDGEGASESTEVNSDNPLISSLIPPSSVTINLPPTSFSISRQTLEDTVYIRKSLDVWIHAKKGVLSNRTLRRLAKLRPGASAVADAEGWWKYAIEATIAFTQVSRAQEAISGEQNIDGPTHSNTTKETTARHRGWLGLARALRRRQRYVKLYQELFANSGEEEHDDAIYGPLLPRQQVQVKTHNLLLDLENELTATEIVAFRMAAYFSLTGTLSHGLEIHAKTTKRISWESIAEGINKTINDSSSSENTPHASTKQRLSLEHRCSMFLEMGQALEQEKLNEKVRQQEVEGQNVAPIAAQSPDIAETDVDTSLWEIILLSREMSLQINDRHHGVSTKMRASQGTDSIPVVRLSCACISKSTLHLDGSWEVGCTIAALQVEDLGFESHQDALASNMHRWRTLVGHKFKDGEEELVQIDGISFQQSARLSVCRQYLLSPPKMDEVGTSQRQTGSNTLTQIRMFPLEVVYSTVPFEAMSRVLATVKTPELAEDYHRMAGRAYEWREKQKKRLLQALAHKAKNILVDVDVAAPVFLVPEVFDRDDSPMLVLDFGRLHFSNAPRGNEVVSADFDDVWWLSLQDMQIQCSTTSLHAEALRTASAPTEELQLISPQQLVERFSLDFCILTQIGEEGEEVKVKVDATLPRLSCNLTSSAVRLGNRLSARWSNRKDEVARTTASTSRITPKTKSRILQEDQIADKREPAAASGPSQYSMSKKVERVFEFQFSAPLITIGLENDVDGRTQPNLLTAVNASSIVSLAIHGIGGSLVKKVSKSGGTSTDFEARLQSLIAVDHYQTAGNDYALLVSSLDPDAIIAKKQENWNDLLYGEPLLSRNALVFVEFTSGDDSGEHSLTEPANDKISIAFHEMYVEWNPETIAAIQQAVRMPSNAGDDHLGTSKRLEKSEEEDEFFDAEEDVFFDSLAKKPDPKTSPLVKMGRESTRALLSQSGSALDFDSSDADSNSFENEEIDQSKTTSLVGNSLEIVFNLSKLHVNFNKCARHRRLFTAEMDRTYIQYVTKPTGGSETTAKLGNIVFSDPSASTCQTIYSQILGLQNGTDGAPGNADSSLLEMKIVSNPKTRVKIRSELHELHQVESPVSLCYEENRVLGSDTHVSARFSPMRFIYLQQLWSEIVDYLFEGIMGYEVLGKIRPVVVTSSAETIGEGKPEGDDSDSNPFLVSFTKFNFSIDSPVVLFPVTYRSPQFLKLSFSHIRATNEFDCNADNNCDDVARWHNNCKIRFESLRVFSTDGTEVSHSRSSVRAGIHVRWPIGPLAHSEIPKWDVKCDVDSLDFSLRKDDYALLQNIIAFNVGEESRHLDEWDALQNLTPKQLQQHKVGVMVHFGYDKKDVAPTTYKISLAIPLVRVRLENKSGAAVGVAQCSNFGWRMTKLADRISKQKLTCDLELVTSKTADETETLLSSRTEGEAPGFSYASISKASGDNVKGLDIVNPTIFFDYPAWKALMGFFSGLPEVQVLSPEQIGNSVQIGDQWYQITASSGNVDRGKESVSTVTFGRRFSWIDSKGNRSQSNAEVLLQQASFQLRVTLTSPSIFLSSENTADSASVVLRLGHLDLLHSKNETGATTKTFFIHELEVYTSQGGCAGRNSHSNENSLIHPWCLSGVLQSCSSEKSCTCESHSIRLGADVLRARAAFSDLTIALDVCLRFLADLRQGGNMDDTSQETSNGDRNTGSLHPAPGEKTSLQSSPEVPVASNKYILSLDWTGLEFLVVDDSGRHFAGSQEVVSLVLGRVLFFRQDNKEHPETIAEGMEVTRQEKITHKMTAQLRSIDVLDKLQPKESPFRQLFSAECLDPAGTSQVSCKTMDWDTFAMQPDSDGWGFSAAPALLVRTKSSFAELATNRMSALEEGTGAVSFSSFDDGRAMRIYTLGVRCCTMQYNPSTVIALQRFLGRFRKQAVQSLEVFNEEIYQLKASYESQAQVDEDAVKARSTNIKADMTLGILSISLNKEHQQRRLLKVDLLGCHTTLSKNKTGVVIDGSVKDVSAWDCTLPDKQEPSTSRQSPNACVLRVLRDDSGQASDQGDAFLEFRFSTFKKAESYGPIELSIPGWVQSHITGISTTGQAIDDCLEVSIGKVELTYLSHKFAEILDYLSNGLPGKGMGATSKAAQGFLKKRIQTKSFLQVRVDSPTVYLPEEESAASGIRVKLGDIQLNSWFEGGTLNGRIQEIDLRCGLENVAVSKISLENVPEDQTDWWRMLSLKITGFSASVFEDHGESSTNEHFLNQPLDCVLMLQKSTWRDSSMSCKCRLSLVNMTLNYSQYGHLYGVMKGNLGRKIDKAKWDNIEKAYDLEVQELEGEASHSLHHVEYASGARHIRYGEKALEEEPNKNIDAPRKPEQNNNRSKAKPSLLDVRFTFDGFALKLRRDDPVENAIGTQDASDFEYDMILLRVQLLEISISNRRSDDLNFHMSLYRIGVFDLGDSGRRTRERLALQRQIGKGRKFLRGLRQPCAFVVLVEGYSRLDSDEYLLQDIGINMQDEPQLVVTVNRVPASAVGQIGSNKNPTQQMTHSDKVTVAKVVLNSLSVNCILRPYREVGAFFALSWPTKYIKGADENVDARDNITEDSTEQEIAIKERQSSTSCLQLKLVAHHPRIFFVSNETDPHSRALVLKGLAVVNVGKTMKTVIGSSSSMGPQYDDVQSSIVVDAQLFSLESFINPDVKKALSLQQRHADMLKTESGSLIFAAAAAAVADDSEPASAVDETLGVALLQPVTTGIEFGKSSRSRFPSVRFACVNVEPISTMLSFDDLQLIESILKRLKAERNVSAGTEETGSIEVTALAKQESAKTLQIYEVVFETASLGLGLVMQASTIIVDAIQDDSITDIRVGDVLFGIEGDTVAPSSSLLDVVRQLASTPRPTKVSFLRPTINVTGNMPPAITDGGAKEKEKQKQLTNSSYTLHFRRGMANGLTFEKSSIAEIPVVTKADPPFLSALISYTETVLLPNPGALVTQVNTSSSVDLGFDEAMAAIAQQCNSCEKFESDVDQTSYSLTFVERESASWGNHDSFDLSMQGATISFIDDLNGRDMPLLRGNLQTLEMQLKQGTGIKTHVLECDSSTSRSLGSDVALTVSAVLRTTIEYYHPIKAGFEPLLEPAQFCILYECHTTSSTDTPDQVAVEVADRLLQNKVFFNQTSRESEVPQLLCLNFSDASAEVLARAMSGWKQWRNTVEKNAGLSDFSEQLSEFPGSTNSLPSLALDEDPQTEVAASNTAKSVAASNAAHAAYLFAQKRGAVNSGKSESSKPLIMRNRTGVSIAFVQQKRASSRSSRSKSSLVGEYKGLEDYLDVTELADGNDARFQLEILETKVGQEATQRVRTYEGHFPRLAVAFQAIAGVVVDSLSNLQVQRAGSSIKHVSFKKSEGTDSSRYSIPILFQVEVRDNFRILTIASAVRFVSLSATIGIEVGVKIGGSVEPRATAVPGPCEFDIILHEKSAGIAGGYSLEIADGDVAIFKNNSNGGLSDDGDKKSEVESIGVSQPGSPIFLPIWLAMKLEPVEVFARPKLRSLSQYAWGAQSVLLFSPSTPIEAEIESRWNWQKTSPEVLGSIRCNAINQDCPAAFLSCYTSDLESVLGDVDLESSLHPQDIDPEDDAICVFIGAGLSIRNMLPLEIEWQAAHGLSQGPSELVDGSFLRNNESSIATLKAGECADAYASNFKVEHLSTRFRLKGGDCWSDWALVSSPTEHEADPDAEPSTPTNHTTSYGPSLCQSNVQIYDEFGAPITLGIRVVPKMAKDHMRHYKAMCFGVDVVVYAELWISNLTSLPLTFGCPALQALQENKSNDNNAQKEEEATQFSAEAALNEMASVLELGAKGSKMDTRNAALQQQAGDVLILPHQRLDAITEEIFEFVEIEGSCIKRRWWASENYWNLKGSSILELSDFGKPWHWVDETWTIDRAGHASAEGWDSCKDLLGIGEGPFSPRRIFDPVHPFRRRRWFRRRSTYEIPSTTNQTSRQGLLPGLQVFHHPLDDDAFSKAKERANQKKRRQRQHYEEGGPRRMTIDEGDPFNIAMKCGDGRWSTPATVSSRGSHRGAVQVFASRWPSLANHFDGRGNNLHTASRLYDTDKTSDHPMQYSYGTAPLKPTLHDLVYHVKVVDGDCGEFSRHMLVSARYSIRNDSKIKVIEVKQSGSNDEDAMQLSPGEISPFYWSDWRLPQLISVRPSNIDSNGIKLYKWSGGFSATILGMTALAIRPSASSAGDIKDKIRSMRTLVELRPGTGGLGMNISFKEERLDGDGALFRIENKSTFNIWLSQEGVLSDPSLSEPRPEELDGDLIRPGEQLSFGLDIPYRQGKYAGRAAATMSELLRVRIALAPLPTRAGIESLKVLGLSAIGESVRLKPSKLFSVLGEAQAKQLDRVRILAITTADGPSRVLQFCIMANPEPENMMSSAFMDSVSYGGSPTNDIGKHSAEGAHVQGLVKSASQTKAMLVAEKLVTEGEARKNALFGETKVEVERYFALAATINQDRQISLRVSFSGFLISLVDSSPSEICVIAANTVDVLAKWNHLRTSDASLLFSVGMFQVDNHIPSAPFPVAISPDGNQIEDKNSRTPDSNERATPGASIKTGAAPPLLFVGIEFAPKHTSGIVCLKSVTVALQNMTISLDLAFLVRLQKYASDAKAHFSHQASSDDNAMYAQDSQLQQTRIATTLPDILKLIAAEKAAAATGVGAAQVYIGAMAVLPCTMTLSVNPAQNLTPAQAAFEGSEAAAIHKAVRKGDLSLGRNTYPLGVIIGRKNKTALAVAHGVFKSIVVDALLRMNDASLNLSGAFLRNQIFNFPQLATYLGAHYILSLRQNVPALLGSLAAIGNPLGLFRGLGDGVSDFVQKPVKGLQKSIQKLDPQYVVDGVVAGTGSLARHTVGGFADSAALLTSTFSKNLAVLTLDRRYAQKRDQQRDQQSDFKLLDGVESGFVKLAQGFLEGITGVVKAPMRGAERKGFEGFFKGLGKGLLGLLVKPVIGISDAATDVFVGVKSSVDGEGHQEVDRRHNQVRPRRALYGRDKSIQVYNLADAAACLLMLRTRLGGQPFLSHLDMDDRVALLSDKRMLLLDSEGKELLLVKLNHISSVEVRECEQGSWSLLIMLNTPPANGSEVEVIACTSKPQAGDLSEQIKHGMSLVENDV